MDTIGGSRIGSKSYRAVKIESSYLSPNNYEAQITALFSPWLVEDIPEDKWATLQGELDCIVRGIISGKGLLRRKTNDTDRN